MRLWPPRVRSPDTASEAVARVLRYCSAVQPSSFAYPDAPGWRDERYGPGMTEEWTGGHLNDGAWWWATALDGVLGGIVGGLFTALAVILTIRHERLSQVRADVRDSASALIMSSVLLPAKVRNGTTDDSEAVQEVLARSIDLISKLTGKWPSVAVELQQRVDRLLAVWCR